MENTQFDKKVYLVGAGPGDAGLLTVKGRELLKAADTVIYDALAGEGILGWISDTAKQIDVGKRSGSHSCSQDEINRILVEQGKTGGLIVRLKGGDPFVFGRGGEEAAVLRENKIPFEVVPGVTSAVAVPAYCGIPVTHRGKASSFHVITGHREAGKQDGTDYEALVRTGGTLIFLMGVGAAADICRSLTAAGMPEDTPAALLQEGTTAGQKKVISTLRDLSEDGRKAGIRPPAIIVVGEVCSLENVCAWSEERSLAGKKILVTRPRKRASGMAAGLRAAGAEVVEFSTIQIKQHENREQLEKALASISSYGWLVFTSPSGAEIFFERMAGRKADMRGLAGVKIAVIGRATADVFLKHGIYPDYMPERYYAKELGEGLARAAGGERILILRADKGSAELTRPLEEAGLVYDDIALYHTVYPTGSAQTKRIRKMLREGLVDYVTFTSGSTVRGFLETLKPDRDMLAGFKAVCIGEETRKTAAACGMDCLVAAVPAMESMTERIIEDVLGGRRT